MITKYADALFNSNHGCIMKNNWKNSFFYLVITVLGCLRNSFSGILDNGFFYIRFIGFVELQDPRAMRVIFMSECSPVDFTCWISGIIVKHGGKAVERFIT
jgi:hypothetical protein